MKVLAKEHSTLILQGSEFTWSTNSPGWEAITAQIFCSKKYFDLAGMSMEEKTLFFEAAGTQTINSPVAQVGIAGDSCLTYDIMTSSPLTNTQLASFISFGNFAQPGAVLTWDETIYARSQMWALTVNEASTGYMVLLNETQFGSMSPTASDRVYSYRIVIPSGVIGSPSMDQLYIYPERHILRAEAKEEPDHEYMMRLLRSYQLQQEPDVD